MRWLVPAVLVALTAAVPAHGAAPASWPPASGDGDLFVHYGEEHVNDVDGLAVLTRVVEDTVRFKPALVTMSGDKVNDGTIEQLQAWLKVMSAYDAAGIPFMAGVGNHDGHQPTPEDFTEHCAGCTPARDITDYKQVFAGRPYPMGDAPPYKVARMGPTERPVGDFEGAATHFFVDYGDVRWIFIDSSCYGIQNCDGPFQNPPDDRGRSQYEFLRDTAAEANAAGKLIFLVTHMPTRDPRDPRHSTPAQVNHVMGKGISPDNQQLELEAQQLGVDAVLIAHIKGQWQYRGAGDIPYYIDGGAGGELYTSGPRGVDHGYWYGFRLLRVHDKRVVTDVVPVLAPNGLTLTGPQELRAGGPAARYEAFARQPATKSERAVVEKLELRDPNPIPRSGTQLPGWLVWLAPLGLVMVLALAPRPRTLRRVLVPALGLGVLALSGMAAAQQSEPTSTPKEALPNPARIFTAGSVRVLRPVASETDDPRRDPDTQTADGMFAPACPGVSSISVTAGWQTATVPVRVVAGPGPVLTRARRLVRTLRRGRRGRRLVSLHLAQPAIVRATVSRRGKRIRRLRDGCFPAGEHVISWSGRRARRGTHRLRLAVKGARTRSFAFRVR